MADDKTKHDKRDASRVAAGEEYEVDHFARPKGISEAEARRLTRVHDNDRAKLTAAVWPEYRGKGPPPKLQATMQSGQTLATVIRSAPIKWEQRGRATSSQMSGYRP